ncbi:hypothetical protein BGZ94_000699 [Podila epigama]|nr:hypothetical protein BGZ94_000699 [Podila epigama]
MKSATIAFCLATTISLLGASKVDAALSAGCASYLNSLDSASNPLSKCRVYTALGFPGLTYAKDHDTTKLQKAISAYCETPACTWEQYDSVFKNLQTKCGSDMVPANAGSLGTTLYMWYLSPPQREAVCFKDTTTGSNSNNSCVVSTASGMIARGQFPDANPNEDDLYGYVQYVTPLTTIKGMDANAFCTSCNQQLANSCANYYSAHPSPFTLNFEQHLSSETLKNDLLFQYKSNCNAVLGVSPTGVFQPTNLAGAGSENGNGRGNGNGSGAGQQQETPSFVGNDASAAMNKARNTMTGMAVTVAVAAIVAAFGVI